MKLPAWNFLKASTASADAIGEQLGALDQQHSDATIELDRLTAERPGLLLDPAADADVKLEKHDAAIARCRRSAELIAARRAAVADQWREAEAREAAEQDSEARTTRHASAVKARSEARKLLTDYEKAAESVATILTRLVDIDQEIKDANNALPDGAKPIIGFEHREQVWNATSLPRVVSPETGNFWYGFYARSRAFTAQETDIISLYNKGYLR